MDKLRLLDEAYLPLVTKPSRYSGSFLHAARKDPAAALCAETWGRLPSRISSTLLSRRRFGRVSSIRSSRSARNFWIFGSSRSCRESSLPPNQSPRPVGRATPAGA